MNIDGSKTNIRARSTHDPIRKREINGLWIIAYYNLNIIFEDETYDNNNRKILTLFPYFYKFKFVINTKYECSEMSYEKN